MTGRFEGKVALITGGGTGIGAATARRLASEGARVVITGRRQGPIEEVASEIDGLAVADDTTDDSHLAMAISAASERFGGLDILVANAGGHIVGSVEQIEPDVFRSGLALNVEGAMLAARHAIPALRRRGGGSIVLVSSTAAFSGFPGLASYMAGKAALLGLNQSVAIDSGADNIRCNVVCPAWVESSMLNESLASVAGHKGCSVDKVIATVTRPIPLRRLGSTKEIAAAIAFLASDDASFITGAVLAVDGGSTVVNASSSAFFDD